MSREVRRIEPGTWFRHRTWSHDRRPAERAVCRVTWVADGRVTYARVGAPTGTHVAPFAAFWRDVGDSAARCPGDPESGGR